MKKIIISSLFCFALFSLCAQNTWNVKLPYTISELWIVSDMIKTQDGGFVVQIGHYIIKYDQNGELVWETEVKSGLPSYWAGGKEMVELDNGYIAGIGWMAVAGNRYLYIMDSQGDSVLFNMYPSYNLDLHGLTADGNTLLCLARNSSQENLVLRFDLNGNVQESVFQHFYATNGNYFDIESQTFTVMSSADIYRFFYDGSIDVIKPYVNEQGLNSQVILAKSMNGLLAAYGRQSGAMIIFDENLDIEYELPYEVGSLRISTGQQTPQCVLPTSDGGFLLTGFSLDWAAPEYTSWSYLIKLGAFGNVEWWRSYNHDFDLYEKDNIPFVVEVDDGYVLTVVDLLQSCVWLVKVNHEGYHADVSETESRPAISIYPNPCNDRLFLDMGQPIPEGTATVFTTGGQLIRQFQVQGRQSELDVSILTSGMYFISVKDENGNVIYSGKFVKT